ncbi:MAG: AmmeMemoRadiSam system radical SAM enzyme [Alphaproteobacteria bacterium]|nr:AmmeMemoRadiSam system radical SAM enzyme [Alphaproteobacteria bacterium]
MEDVLGPEILRSPSTVPGRYWHRLEDGRFQCDICPRFCRLRPGQRGLCFVRGAGEHGIVLTSYGRSSGFCVDPIEKKPLNHFLPGSAILSFGTAGCNLTCKFCQNWDMSKSRAMDTLADAASPETLVRAAQALDCRSIAFTYNDPVVFLEYAVDVAKACRAAGIKTVAVTAGYMTEEPRREFYEWMDAANVDLKGFTEAFYHRVCGGHLQPVLDTLVYLKRETKVWFEITTLLIPGENDSDSELTAMTSWILDNLGPDVPLHFTAFHPDWKMTDKPRTPHETLLRARRIAVRRGLRYVYVGNVHDRAASSTYCHHCGEVLIGRDWHALDEWNLTPDGHCRKCGTAMAGVIEGAPGTWGRKRIPVRLQDFEPGGRRHNQEMAGNIPLASARRVRRPPPSRET